MNADLVPTLRLDPDPGYTLGKGGGIYVFKKRPVMSKAMIIKRVTPFSAFASFHATPSFQIPTAVALKCFRSYIHTTRLHSFHVFLSWPEISSPHLSPHKCFFVSCGLTWMSSPGSIPWTPSLGAPCSTERWVCPVFALLHYIQYLFLCPSPTPV